MVNEAKCVSVTLPERNKIGSLVLDGTSLMGLVADHYDSELQLELAKAKNANDQFSQEMRDTYNQQVTDAQNALTRATSDLSHLSTSVGEAQAQIDAGNVVTCADFTNQINATKASINKVSGEIAARLAQVKTRPTAYANLDSIKQKFPKGVDGIVVAADTNHWYYWNNSAWIDGGVYNSQAVDQD